MHDGNDVNGKKVTKLNQHTQINDMRNSYGNQIVCEGVYECCETIAGVNSRNYAIKCFEVVTIIKSTHLGQW
jgi:hypothetical protein